jgi:enoyl-CoA hydratase/carnithine racemase
VELTRVTWEQNEGVGVLTLNRPERLNALDLRTIVECDHLVERAWNDPSIRCLLITGAGRGFCSGADVKDWGSESEEEAPPEDNWVLRMHRLMSRIHRLPKPVIAAVNGVAVGAGFDLSLVADLRIASTKARFGMVYINVGFCPDAGGSYLLPRLIGPTKASELIFTGRIIDAPEANDLGLLNAMVEPDDLMETAMELARRLANGPTVAIGLSKENIRQNLHVSFEDALRNERRSGEICGRTEDHNEGLKAVMEKRAPAFVGR